MWTPSAKSRISRLACDASSKIRLQIERSDSVTALRRPPELNVPHTVRGRGEAFIIPSVLRVTFSSFTITPPWKIQIIRWCSKFSRLSVGHEVLWRTLAVFLRQWFPFCFFDVVRRTEDGPFQQKLWFHWRLKQPLASAAVKFFAHKWEPYVENDSRHLKVSVKHSAHNRRPLPVLEQQLTGPGSGGSRQRSRLVLRLTQSVFI